MKIDNELDTLHLINSNFENIQETIEKKQNSSLTSSPHDDISLRLSKILCDDSGKDAWELLTRISNQLFYEQEINGQQNIFLINLVLRLRDLMRSSGKISLKEYKKVRQAVSELIKYTLITNRPISHTREEGACNRKKAVSKSILMLKKKHHDLVNVPRLISLIKHRSDSGILGALVENLLIQNPRSLLKNVVKYCKKSKSKEFVFERIAHSKTLSTINKQNNHKLWKKWNYISSEFSQMPDAIAEKKFVLKHNFNLNIRALMGANTRSDVFSFLIYNKKATAYQISKTLNISYEAVHRELNHFKNIGYFEDEYIGKRREFRYVKKEFLKL